MPLLALSLGVATAVFTVVDAVIHPIVPFRDVQELYAVTSRGDGASRRVTAVQRLASLQRRSAVAAEVGFSEYQRLLIESGGRTEHVAAGRVSGNYFDILGVHAVRGRLFSASTAEVDAGAGVVVSFGFWRQWLGAPQSLEGITIDADGHSYLVIGVAPPGMARADAAELWLAVPPSAVEETVKWPSAVVRARPGIALTAFQRDLRSVAAQLTAEHGAGLRAFNFDIRPFLADSLPLGDIHFALIAAAVALVLIGCANLANLVLARGLARQRDVALRLAVGGTRRDVVLDTLSECLLIALAGAGAGLLLAVWGLAVVQRVMPQGVPLVGDLSATIDWRVYAFSVTAALSTSLLFGVAPAVRVSRIDISAPLKEGASGITASSRQRANALVVGELALSLAVLVGAVLLVRASGRMRSLDFGIDYDAITTARVFSYATDISAPAERDAAYRRLADGIRALPGVEGVAWRSATTMPTVTAAPVEGGNREIHGADVWFVSADYLHTMGVQLVSGRDFMDGDAFREGVVILDDSAAKALWGSSNPLGQRLALGGWRSATTWLPVVGVARHVRTYGASVDFFATAGPPTVYVVQPALAANRELVVRSRPDRVRELTYTVRRYLRDAAPPGMWYSVAPLRATYENVLAAQAFVANVFVALALIALVISAWGVYSVLTYTVARQRRDYAVRVALGATRLSVGRMVVRDAGVIVLAGTGIGAFLAMWSSRFVDTFLFDLYRVDAVSLILAEGVLCSVALSAALIPAWRASTANPVDVLRGD